MATTHIGYNPALPLGAKLAAAVAHMVAAKSIMAQLFGVTVTYIDGTDYSALKTALGCLTDADAQAAYNNILNANTPVQSADITYFVTRLGVG